MQHDESQRLPTNFNSQGLKMPFLDMNLDGLKTHLDSIANTINQHAELITALQQALLNVPINKSIADSYSNVSESIKLYDNNLQKVVINQIGKGLKPENSANPLEASSNKFINRLNLLCHAVTNNYQGQQELLQQQKSMLENIEKKQDSGTAKEKHKKFKTRVFGELQDIRQNYDKKIMDVERKFQQQLQSWEDKLQDVEKKTLWRIQDVEEMMKRRITEEYVDDSCKAIEEKLKRELVGQLTGDAEKIERINIEVQTKILQIENSSNEKSKANRKSIKEIEEKLEKKVMMKDVFEDFRKNFTAQQNEITKQVREFEKKNDFQSMYDKVNNRLKALEERFGDQEKEISRKFSEIMLNGGGGGSGGDVKVITNNIDPHKLCQVEADLNRNIELTRKHADILQKLQQDLQHNIDKLENSQLDNISPRQNQTGGGADSARVEKLEKAVQELQLTIGDHESAKQTQNELKELQKKFETVKELEKKITRILKEFDVNTITRQIKSKAELDDVLKDFAICDQKITTNTENISYLRKDVDNLIILYKKLIQLMQSGGGFGDQQSILTTKKLYPVTSLNCLSCGQTKQPRTTMQGADGRQYKVDQAQTYSHQYQQQLHQMAQSDHFGVFTQDSQFQQQQSKTSEGKLTRPSTAQIRKDDKKALIRPGSAKK